MYGIEQEIAGIKAQLDVLLEKKNQLNLSLVIAYDDEKKFGLRQQIKNLDIEIAALRQQLRDLEQQTSGSGTPIRAENRAEVKELVAKGKLKEALTALEELLTDAEKNSAVLLKSRLAALEGEKNQGIINQGDYTLERNKITAAVLALCNR